jgi:hypothetical protein
VDRADVRRRKFMRLVGGAVAWWPLWADAIVSKSRLPDSSHCRIVNVSAFLRLASKRAYSPA